MGRGLLAVLFASLALGVPSASAAAPAPLKGPPGVSSNKVLVIGTDGTRWDLVQREIKAGKAPNIARLAGEGLGAPTFLAYQPPEALTVSDVGWSTIATGVWPAKHGITGYTLNTDPHQATKNGFDDFLTRIERTRPALSTFLVSDWPNIGLHQNGGPIFGDAIDAKHSIAAADTIPAYIAGDDEVAAVAERYLREGSPDAGFVYFGVVDETAHAVGSATPAYTDAIAGTDRRIGRLLAAIRARPDYDRERWTVIITTDHGEKDLSFGSVFAHGFGTTLERTSFVVASGPGVFGRANPRIVDITPTVLHQLGLAVNPAWGLDGRTFATGTPPAPPPAAGASVRAAGRRLTVILRSSGAERLRTAGLTLPSGLRLRGRRPLTATAGGRTFRVSVRGGRIAIRLPRGGVPRVVVRSRRGALTARSSVLRKLRRGGLRIKVRAGGSERFDFSTAIAYRR